MVPDKMLTMLVRTQLTVLFLAAGLAAAACSGGTGTASTASTSSTASTAGAPASTPGPAPATATTSSSVASTPTPAPTDPSPSPSPDAASTVPQGDEPVDLDPADFTTDIDNPYWPMAPGTRWTYTEVEEGEVKAVVVIATDQAKEIANGITARVVRDTVTLDGEIIEDTFDWYAQDGDGNVWYLGEDTAEFEAGDITTRDGSFEAGVDGALPGIAMPGDPRPGLAYRQEFYEGQAEDNGEVLSVDDLAETPFGQFDSVLLTKDTITLEPDVQEFKLYAPGVGPVLVLSVSGGGGGREELVSMDQAPAGAGTGPLGSPND